MDGLLVRSGRRLADLDCCEYLSFVYGWMVEHMDRDARAEFDHSLLPDEAVMPDQETLPAHLRGRRPPAFWRKGRAAREPTQRPSGRPGGKPRPTPRKR